MDETIKIWELENLKNDNTLQPKYTFNKQSNIKRSRSKKGPFPHEIETFYSIAFSNDCKYIASGDQKGLLVIREISTQKEIYRTKLHNSAIHSIDFSPIDSSLLATASDDSRIKLINLNNNSNTTLGLKEDKHKMGLNSVAFSYKGDLLVSSATDNCIKLWSVDELALLLSYEREGGNLIDKVTFFPNKYDFTTNSIDKNIGLWQINESGNINKTEISFE
jgi:WD40 repeat protein